MAVLNVTCLFVPGLIRASATVLFFNLAIIVSKS